MTANEGGDISASEFEAIFDSDEEETFEGFSFRDQRRFLPGASRETLFVSARIRKQGSNKLRSDDDDSDHTVTLAVWKTGTIRQPSELKRRRRRGRSTIFSMCCKTKRFFRRRGR